MRAVVMLCLVAGCGLTVNSDKNACRTQADCRDGYTCEAEICVPTGIAQNDLGMHDAATSHDDLACTSCDMIVSNDGGMSGTPGSWATKASMPTARTNLGVVTGKDGRIYAIGGYESSASTTTVEAYDPKLDAWTTVASMKTARYSFAAVLGPDDRIYVIGGDDASAGTLVESYDSSANTWRSEPSLPEGRGGGAAAVVGGRIYVVGGFSQPADVDVGKVASFAPGDAAWMESSYSMTTPRADHAVVLLPSGSIMALGGLDADGDKLNLAETLDPAHPGWYTAPSFVIPRDGPAAAVSGGKVYVVGGNAHGYATEDIVMEVEVYDPTAKAWSYGANMLTPRWSVGVATDASGAIYAIGGTEASGAFALPSSVVEALTP